MVYAGISKGKNAVTECDRRKRAETLGKIYFPKEFLHVFHYVVLQHRIFPLISPLVFVDKTKKLVVYLTPNEKYLEEVCQELIKVKSEIFA